MGAVIWVRSRGAGGCTFIAQLCFVSCSEQPLALYLAGPLSQGWVQGRTVTLCVCEERVLCALGPLSGLHFVTGPVEEVELQVFPDATVDSQRLDAVGEGQVCVNVSLSVPAWSGVFRAAWAVGQGRIIGSFALRMG